MNITRTFTGTVFIAYGYYIISADGVRTGNRCIEDLSKSFTVQLQCPAGEWIHVVHEAYGDGDIATCRLKSAESCNRLHASDQHGLVVNCNGKQSCREVIIKQSLNNCNIADAAAEVKYNCIKGSVNMCSPVTTAVNGSVYLHSPGFPDSVSVNSMCVVRITGQTLQVTLLEQYMRSGILNISGDGRQLWSYVYMGQYNRVLPGQAAEILIVYDNHEQHGSNVWIRVADSGQMNIRINREILDESTTPTSTHQPSRSPNMSGTNTSGTPTETMTGAPFTPTASSATVTSTNRHTTHLTENIAPQLPSKSTMAVSTTVSAPDASNSGNVVIALSMVCGILVLIIVVLVIYFMVVKPFRKKQDTSSNTGTSVGHDETNVYDGIQRNTSEAASEHTYGNGGPVYANSVNGDDPYVNA